MSVKDIEEAFELARNLNHDVYDIVYVVLALKANAKGIITTDTDFKRICERLHLHYLNPVPKEILKKFYTFK